MPLMLRTRSPVEALSLWSDAERRGLTGGILFRALLERLPIEDRVGMSGMGAAQGFVRAPDTASPLLFDFHDMSSGLGVAAFVVFGDMLQQLECGTLLLKRLWRLLRCETV